MASHIPLFLTALTVAMTPAFAANLSQAQVNSKQHEPLSAVIDVSEIDAANFSVSGATPAIYNQMGLVVDAPLDVVFIPTGATTGRIEVTSQAPINAPFTDVVLDVQHQGEQMMVPQTLLLPINASAIPSSNVPLTTDVDLPSIAPSPYYEDAAIYVETAPDDTPQFPAGGNSDDAQVDNASLNLEITDGKSQVQEALAQITPSTQTALLNLTISRIILETGQTLPSLTYGAPFETQVATIEPKPEPQTAPPSTVYVVQKGDSLWSIASALAKQNNLSVHEVMSTLHAQNPSAFNKGNINQIQAGAHLDLPEYRVIPSQKAIQESNKIKTSMPPSPVVAPVIPTKVTPPKPLPRAQVNLITPNKGQTSSAQSPNSALVSNLTNKRQSTATRASRVNNLNSEVSSYTRKMQIQNQRLAELEQRLKELKNR